MNQNESKRNHAIDALRTLACFLVVCIHCPFPGEAGKYVVAIARAGTVLFFMITGFYADSMIQRGRVKRYLLRLLMLAVFANVFYFFVYWSDSGEGFRQYLIETARATNPFMLFLFNYTYISGHLWYLNAALYAVIIYALFSKYNAQWILLYIWTPLGLFLDEVLGRYSNLIWGGKSTSDILEAGGLWACHIYALA